MIPCFLLGALVRACVSASARTHARIHFDTDAENADELRLQTF